MQISFPFQRKP